MNSIKKSNWDECKEYIQSSNPEFYKLLSDVSPSSNMPIYIATYAFGENVGSKKDVFIPNNHGGTIKLGDKETPPEIMRDLGYGKNSLPLGMMITNFCEWYKYDKETDETFPFAIQGNGTIFNKQIVFQEEEGVMNSTVSICSGSRTAFMLPNIGSRINHERIREAFNIYSAPPKHPKEHHQIFKGILKDSNWHSKLIFFSDKWVNEINNNPKWVFIKLFMSEQIRKNSGKDIGSSLYNDLFMTANKINKFRPTPFLIDTAKVIFNIAMNRGCGFAPATDEKKFPLKEIQDAYQNTYEIKYTPTIMVPSTLSQGENAVYYSLQQPSSKINTFKIKLNNSTIRELEALKDIINAYKNEFMYDSEDCYGSDLYKSCHNLNLDFYHNQPNVNGINHSEIIIKNDKRFEFSNYIQSNFSTDSKFFRGCMKISRR